MNTPTYQQQFDKLTEAYISENVFPNSDCACFVGNLLNGKGGWSIGRACNFRYINDVTVSMSPTLREGIGVVKEMENFIKNESGGLYTPLDILELESCFMNAYIGEGMDTERSLNEVIDEDLLFIAFEKTLDLLKTIHEKKGETIQSTPYFEKRKLTHT